MIHPPLYILRHGQTTWNAEHRIQGRLDSPLTDQGRTQAQHQNVILKSQNLAGFSAYCSPQGRAVETAKRALDGLNITPTYDTRLAEIGVGDWEGLRRDDLIVDRPLDESEESALDLYERAPGREGFQALHARCLAFLSDLKGPSILITHGITSRMLRVILQDLSIADIGSIEGGQGIVFHMTDGHSNHLT